MTREYSHDPEEKAAQLREDMDALLRQVEEKVAEGDQFFVELGVSRQDFEAYLASDRCPAEHKAKLQDELAALEAELKEELDAALGKVERDALPKGPIPGAIEI